MILQACDLGPNISETPHADCSGHFETIWIETYRPTNTKREQGHQSSADIPKGLFSHFGGRGWGWGVMAEECEHLNRSC